MKNSLRAKTKADIVGATISLNREPLYCLANVWEVKYKVRIGRKVEARTSLVVGISSCDGEQAEREAAMASASRYGGKKITITSANFLGSAVMAGHVWECQKLYWDSLPRV